MLFLSFSLTASTVTFSWDVIMSWKTCAMSDFSWSFSGRFCCLGLGLVAGIAAGCAETDVTSDGACIMSWSGPSLGLVSTEMPLAASCHFFMGCYDVLEDLCYVTFLLFRSSLSFCAEGVGVVAGIAAGCADTDETSEF